MIDYKTSVDVQVRFSDTDALGHVNNMVYLSYLELARIEYIKRVFGAQFMEGLGEAKTKDFGVIIARVEIDYRSPAFHYETLVVGIRAVELGGASLKLDYRIEEKKTGRLVAEAKTIMVSYDYRANQVKRWSDEVREKVEAYDGIA